MPHNGAQPEMPTSQQSLETCPTCVTETSPAILSDIQASPWIECSVCKQWYHLLCLRISPSAAAAINVFHCPKCEKKHGPSVNVRASKRKRANVDYVAFDKGEVSVARDRHPYAARFDGLYRITTANADLKKKVKLEDEKAGTGGAGGGGAMSKLGDWFNDAHKAPHVDGSQLTKEWANATGVVEPVLIPAEHYDTLGMRIPPDLTVDRVAALLGPDAPVQVVDVFTQNLASPPWTMDQWAAYFSAALVDRDRILNVISLEISGTPLGSLIERPAFVQAMDWVDMVWPASCRARNDYPKARLYCLMSVQDAYTDFHIDFGGTSVFYHLIRGAKVFVFVKPTPANLRKYEAWCGSADQGITFFADLVRREHTHVVCVSAGDSLIIPSGWIHAVYTPEDSLIIGGNFLTPVNIPTQIELARLEVRTKVPKKFRYPFFDRVVWYAAVYYMDIIGGSPQTDSTTDKDQPPKRVLPSLELQGLTDLRDYLLDHVLAIEASPPSSSSYVKHLLAALPKTVKQMGPRKFLIDFAHHIAKLQHAESTKTANDDDPEAYLSLLPEWALDKPK